MTPTCVLFLCTGNSCRSQMAEGWLRALGGERFVARSAGLEPKGLNPLAVQVMAEAGVDIAGQQSKPLAAALEGVDLFIPVCDHAAEHCPMTPPGAKVIRWSFVDPPRVVAERGLDGEAALEVYRAVRDEIRAAVAELCATAG